MKARINKIITWQEKEYAHIIEDEPYPFCDLCSFSDICQKVLTKELAHEDSPMPICEKLSEEANTHYAFFIEANKAEGYCNRRNKNA